MKAKNHSGTIIKWQYPERELGKKGKVEVKQIMTVLLSRFWDDWVFGNNFVQVEFHNSLLIFKQGTRKGYKEIDITRKEALRLARLILAEYYEEKNEP